MQQGTPESYGRPQQNEEVLCIIPARGGSRGIPRKNMCAVAGIPLVVRAVTQALLARRVDRVVVSTDDSEIADTARRAGAEVVTRPVALSGDSSSSESAVLHALDTLLANEGYRPYVVVFVQCTSPLSIASDIDGTVEALLAEKADSALAVAPSHRFIWRRQEDGSATGVNHDASVRQRRQDMHPEYVETGAVYAFREAGFRQHGHRFFGHTALYETPSERYLEVDEPFDLLLADTAARWQDRENRMERLPQRPAALVMDFDGVLTDNAVWLDEAGVESVRCHRGDGMGLERLRAAGVPMIVLSKERNPVVTARCRKLGVQCVQGIDDKLSAMTSWLDEQRIDPAEVVYLGNDINDAACLGAVGCGVVVADAHADVAASAAIVLETKGGYGAVRELTDMIEVRIARAAAAHRADAGAGQ